MSMGLITCLNNCVSMRQRIAASRERLYRVALAWCGDGMLADDLVQEAMSLALQKSHQLRDKERLNAWLYSILNNRWKQYLRSRRPHEDLDDERPCDKPGPDLMIDRIEIVSRVRQAVSILPVEQRRVLALVDLEGFSYSDVAEILEIPAGTVMSRLHRARKGLVKLLEPEEAPLVEPASPSLRRVK
ncbi:hypothetical protein MNBD_GAMMA15-1197 [hydrothermal vent metagenome]|uniref:RNA polymerase sigma-54 factor RpoN n=1 Tax=hydrothermal vent metagenome TaxID=652676 RepID=A0A3B0ZDJ1_9ZZZZ